MSSTPDGSPVARSALVSTAANPLAEAWRCRYRRRGYSSTSSRQRRHSLISTSHHFHFSSFVKQEDTLVYYTNLSFSLSFLSFYTRLTSFPSFSFPFSSSPHWAFFTPFLNFSSSSHLTSILFLVLLFPLIFLLFIFCSCTCISPPYLSCLILLFPPPFPSAFLVSFPTLSSLSLASCFLSLSLPSSLVL